MLVLSVGAGAVAASTGAAASLTHSPLPGDLNCDGVVNRDEIAALEFAHHDAQAWYCDLGQNVDYSRCIADHPADARIGIGGIPGGAEPVALGLRARDAHRRGD